MIITNRIAKSRIHKISFSLAFAFLILPLSSFSQQTKDDEIVFEDAKDPPALFSFGDTLILGGDTYRITRADNHKKACIVSSNGKLGVIDYNLNFIIKPLIAKRIKFENNGIHVVVDDKIGLFGYHGEEIIPIEMKGLYHFYEGIVLCQIAYQRVKLFDLKKGFLSNEEFCSIKSFSKGKRLVLASSDCTNYGIVSLDSLNSNINFEYESPAFTHFVKGCVLVKDKKYGVLHYENEVQIPFVYDQLIGFRDNFIVQKDSKWGIIDQLNNVLLDFNFNSIKALNHEDGYVVEKNGKVGIIKLNGEYRIPLEYDYITDISTGSTFEVHKNGKLGLVNIENKTILPIKYESIKDTWLDSYIVRINENHGLFSYSGEELIPAQYYQINKIRGNRRAYTNDGYLVTNEELKCSFFKIDGTQMTGFVFEEFTLDGGTSPIEVKIEENTFMVNAHGACVENCPSSSFLEKYGLKKKE